VQIIGTVFTDPTNTAPYYADLSYLDAVQLEQKDHATPYGSTGTAYATTSRRQYPWTIPVPVVTSTDLLRRRVGETTWKRIAILSGTTYADYSAASDTAYEYEVVANAANGTNATSDPTLAPVLDLHGVWLHDPTNPASTIHRFQWDGHGRSYDWEPEVAEIPYVGRTYPVAEFGTMARETVSLTLPLDTETDDVTSMDRLVRLKKPLLYRDGRGRKMFCVVRGTPYQDTVYGEQMAFAASTVDYDETV
jgi:hypothetical protein